MRLLFEINTNDYDINGKAFVRPSSRCIYIKEGMVAMVHSLKYNYYKFPGGGIDDAETKIDALIREAREEAGLVINKESIREYGYVHRIQKDDTNNYDYFVQDNYYYICDALDAIETQNLDDYEKEEGFKLEFVNYQDAINVNRNLCHGPKDQIMIEREAKVLELLHLDGLL